MNIFQDPDFLEKKKKVLKALGTACAFAMRFGAAAFRQIMKVGKAAYDAGKRIAKEHVK